MAQDKKKRLRSKADKIWFHKCVKEHCEICGRSGSLQVHHFFPKSRFNHLRYDLENGITVCQGCHMKIHFAGDPQPIHTIIQNRGEDWYERLKERSKERHESFLGVKYYEEVIINLNETNN